MARPPRHTRDSLELVILSVLNEESLYGYLIIKRVAARSDGAIRLTPGALYPLLHELEGSGLITASWETVRSERSASASGDGRRRKWYRLAPKGRRRLAQRVTAHRAQQAMLEAFLPSTLDGEAAT